MKFIAQFRSSICGSNSHLLSDVFLLDDRVFVFDKHSSGDFELRIIESNSYFEVTKEFEDFIANKDVSSADCNLLHLWRAKKVSTPELMPMRYYQDVMQTYNFQNLRFENRIGEIQKMFNKLNQELNENTY
jgi:hypothetical protein